MVMVLSFVELVDGLAAFKMVAVQNAGLLELCQHAVHRGQPNVGPALQQVAEDVLGGHVALHATLENLQDLQARNGGLEATALEVVDLHGGSRQVGLEAAGGPLQCPDDIGLPLTMTALSTIRLPLLASALVLVTVLPGCGITRGLGSDTFRPYVPDLVQGNFVSREQRQYLKPGMTRAQVRDVLGTPLVASVFHEDRWDYAFSIRRQGLPPQQFKVTLFFKDDVLSLVESDELPSESEFVQRLSRSVPSGKPPVLEATEEQLRQFPRNASAPAAPRPQVPLPATYPPLESAPR